jgi:hypothetical protein
LTNLHFLLLDWRQLLFRMIFASLMTRLLLVFASNYFQSHRMWVTFAFLDHSLQTVLVV